MKKLFSLLFSLVVLLTAVWISACTSSRNDTLDFLHVDTFVEAKPIWAQGRESEKNLTLHFYKEIFVSSLKQATVFLAASTDYRLTVNGQFVAHGPCVAAHDFYRVDVYDLKPFLHKGKNEVLVEVAGYNHPSYYLLDQKSFLQAEVVLNGSVVAATGATDTDKAFALYDTQMRKADVPTFSFQRPFTEYYCLDANAKITDKPRVTSAIQEPKALLGRGVPYPETTILPVEKCIGDSLFCFATNSSGFIGTHVTVTEPALLMLFFDELLAEDGRVDWSRLGCNAYVIYELKEGIYSLETFEPYTFKYLGYRVLEGNCQVDSAYVRSYVNSDAWKAEFHSSNPQLDFLFEAARQTHKQSTLDVFMDTPSRERAGWLCDSYFSARVAFDFSGNTLLEHNFLENFLLPDHFKHLPDGMLPMCYPSDHPNENFIPNWAMWFVLELEEYYRRSGDRQMVDALKEKMYALNAYFQPFLNEDGLLEKLEKWIFVEWSQANSFVQDVNYPTNMLYASMLEVMARLYDDAPLKAQADKIREVIREQSFNGYFFRDNAVRVNGKLVVQDNMTEVCQYSAFFFDTASPETYPDLWKRLMTEFGPVRKNLNPYPEVYFANAFVGNYLRLELLSRYGHVQQLLDESLAEYLIMANTTGTLWENMTTVASCNHGFASHIAHVLLRDVLGIKKVDPLTKQVTVHLTPCSLTECSGRIPIGNEFIEMAWTYVNEDFQYTLKLPKGWTACSM